MLLPAERINRLSSGIFSQLDVMRQKVIASGVNVINLGIGSPDGCPAPHIIGALHKEIDDPANYNYTLTHGTREFRVAVVNWYMERFKVELDPETEVLPLIGSQDGLAHIFLAYLNKGDLAIIPDPGYPVYSAGLALAEGELYPLPLVEKNNYLPKLTEVPEEIARKAKMLVLNYPNNPLAAVANEEFFAEVINFANLNQILVCHDIAYSELAFDNYKPISILQISNAREWCVEFHSMSKTYNMAGCRIGFVVGNKQVIENLAKIKSNIDFGIFKPILQAGIAALTGTQEVVRENVQKYEERRNMLIEKLAEIGWHVSKPVASMFVWAKLPTGFSDSFAFAKELLEKAGVLVIPGVAFGQNGEGYVRFALVEDKERLVEAVERIKTANIINSVGI